jgi:2-polyprenyl-6-methoxyphenol hydroxylase-like FAD-dependent oxidoreductase
MLLARRGYRVLIVDRATFPSDTISTHIIWQPGVNQLLEWGLGDRLGALGAPGLDTMTLDFGAFALTGKLPGVGRATLAHAPRRKKLDPMLVEAAAEAGAEMREGFSVEEILFEGARVSGIRGRDKSGASVVEHAAVVVGADGVHSTVARSVQRAEYNVRPTFTCWYYSYWSGLQDRLRLFSRPHNAFGAIPTNDGLACLAVAWPHRRFSEIKADIEGHYLSALDAAPAFKDEVMSARREERYYGTAHIPNYYRKPYGPGWALVGDSGYHKDPILAQGISDALRDAGLLANALDRVFSERDTWDEALSAYEATRNAAVEGIYHLNADYASLEPPPAEVQMLMQALQGNAEDTSRFLGTMTGAVPVSEFYAAENVARILSEQQRTQTVRLGSV